MVNQTLDYEIMTQAIDISDILNNPDKNGWTPLMKATRNNDLASIKGLIRNHVKVNLCNNKGFTALMIAVSAQNYKAAELLLDYGADANLCEPKYFWTPLMTATRLEDYAIVNLLLEHGAKETINYKNLKNISALTIAINHENQDIFNLLIQNGANVVTPKDGSWTPMMYAAKTNNLNALEKLLENGADINERRHEGSSVLKTAIEFDSVKAAQFLLKKGANFDLSDDGGWTPLMSAAHRGNQESIALLLKYGADVNAMNKCILNPLKIAIDNNDLKTLQTLLASKKVNVNLSYAKGWTSLMNAANTGKKEIIEELIKSGARINAKNDNGITALRLAVDQNYPEIVQTLINHGAKVNTKDKESWYAIINCAKKGNFDMFKTLVENGADLNVTNNNKEDCEFWANKMLKAKETPPHKFTEYTKIIDLIKSEKIKHNLQIKNKQDVVHEKPLLQTKKVKPVKVAESIVKTVFNAIAQGNSKAIEKLTEQHKDIGKIVNDAGMSTITFAFMQATNSDLSDPYQILEQKKILNILTGRYKTPTQKY